MSEPEFAQLEREGWTLVDSAQRYLARDGVYWLPPEQARRTLAPGTLVKMVFVWASPAPDGPGRERMWVEVAFEQDGAFHGHLANTPFHPTPPLKQGEGVWFRPEHVVDVQAPGGEPLSTTSKLVKCHGHGPSDCCYLCEHLTEGSGLASTRPTGVACAPMRGAPLATRRWSRPTAAGTT